MSDAAVEIDLKLLCVRYLLFFVDSLISRHRPKAAREGSIHVSPGANLSVSARVAVLGVGTKKYFAVTNGTLSLRIAVRSVRVVLNRGIKKGCF